MIRFQRMRNFLSKSLTYVQPFFFPHIEILIFFFKLVISGNILHFPLPLPRVAICFKWVSDTCACCLRHSIASMLGTRCEIYSIFPRQEAHSVLMKQPSKWNSDKCHCCLRHCTYSKRATKSFSLFFHFPGIPEKAFASLAKIFSFVCCGIFR